MAQLQVKKVEEILEKEGFSPEQTRKVRSAINANLPDEAYNKAVVFLGWVTVALVVGSIECWLS